MEKDTTKKYWFKRKRYGWGWGLPCSLEGWAVFAVYVAIIIFLLKTTDFNQYSGSDALVNIAPQFIFLTLVLFIICYSKGEPPKWTWGDDK